MFIKFATEWLYPLAELNIIHRDIRCGYNWTANVMVNLKENDIVLIDFDSLLSLHRTLYEPLADKRYIKNRRYNAFEFVCVQCIGLAQSWKDGTNQQDFDMAKVADRFVKQDLSSSYESEDAFKRFLDILGEELTNGQESETGFLN